MSSGEAGVGGGTSGPLAGRTVLVTAFRPEFGAAIARSARGQGARIALAMPSGAGAGASSGELPREDVRLYSAQLDSETGVDRLLAAVVDDGLAPDTVIAAVSAYASGRLADVSFDDWRRGVIDPIRSLFWLLRRAVEECLASGGPVRMIIVLEAPPVGEADAIVVEALRSMVRSLAKEYGRRDHRFNLVVQGIGDARGADRPGMEACIGHALFLASSDASFVNGEVVIIASPGPA